MEIKKTKTPATTVTRNMVDFSNLTGNVYETIATLSKRSNQISTEIKQELHRKIEEYTSSSDSLEEVFENREQIEIAKHYEQLPKPTLVAVQEYLNEELYYRNPNKETELAEEAEVAV